MEKNTKRQIEQQIECFLIPFLTSQEMPQEARERVASALRAVQIAARELLKYNFDLSIIPAESRGSAAEYLALSALMDAAFTRPAAMKILPRIKQCDHCKKWFYGRRYSDRFCPGGNCRKLHWAAGNEGKKHRAAKARESRKRDKDRGADALRLVRALKK